MPDVIIAEAIQLMSFMSQNNIKDALGCIQVLDQTPSSVCWALWYGGREPLGPLKPPDKADKMVRREAAIYGALGKHDRILNYIGVEYLYNNPMNPPCEQTRLELALQFAVGLAYMHSRGVVWSDVSTRDALMFDGWRLKLCDFVGTIHREVFALGSGIYEIVEWKVPYGSEYDVSPEEVYEMLIAGKWPELNSSNPAKDIRRCWAYEYETAQQVVLTVGSRA
ncbi:hypothetical protein F5883DRAFT_650057 [Diaporthe sp. PMI_573]|nr:hypothetical protein F5883DRAFT_650057 [Diaporthaceae sp. PMI_573]